MLVRKRKPSYSHIFNGICTPGALRRLFLMVGDYFP